MKNNNIAEQFRRKFCHARTNFKAKIINNPHAQHRRGVFNFYYFATAFAEVFPPFRHVTTTRCDLLGKFELHFDTVCTFATELALKLYYVQVPLDFCLSNNFVEDIIKLNLQRNSFFLAILNQFNVIKTVFARLNIYIFSKLLYFDVLYRLYIFILKSSQRDFLSFYNEKITLKIQWIGILRKNIYAFLLFQTSNYIKSKFTHPNIWTSIQWHLKFFET